MAAASPAAVYIAALDLLRTVLDPAMIGAAAIPTTVDHAGPVPMLTDSGTFRPYGILYRVAAGARHLGASYAAQPESITVVRLQFVGVGIQATQAETFADAAVGVLVDRDPDPPFGWVHTLTVPGHNVIDRAAAGDGHADAERGVFSAARWVDVTIETA